MSEREAWLWIVSQAAWKGTRHRVGGSIIEVPRGSFMVTLRDLQAAFMWRSDKRVRTFLKMLETEGMIERSTVGSRNAPKTHVTICKYEKYQSIGRTKGAGIQDEKSESDPSMYQQADARMGTQRTHQRRTERIEKQSLFPDTDVPKTYQRRTEDAVKEQGNKGTIEVTDVTSVQSDVEKHFEDFWEAFPHRQGKKTKKGLAKQSFAKAIASGATVQQIAAGVEALSRDPDVSRGFGRGPVPWLNQQGWLDEIPETHHFNETDSTIGIQHERTTGYSQAGRSDHTRGGSAHNNFVAGFAAVANKL